MQLAVILIVLALTLSSCAAPGQGAPTPEPSATAASTKTPNPTATASPSPTDTPAPTREPLPVQVEGKTLSQDARNAQGKTLLPLVETMETLGFKARVTELSEDDGKRRVHTFQKAQEEIEVSYLITDNTVSDVSFVRGKLIVPVDRVLVFEDEIAFAPANFFEEAVGVFVIAENGQVRVSSEQPDLSPEGQKKAE